MMHISQFPAVVIVLSFFLMAFSAWMGLLFRWKQLDIDPNALQDLDLIVGATLTLLGLIVGFTFSMAITRYDVRKSYEEAEANAIGTEYMRADLLPDADSARVRALLREYLAQRILFYQTHTGEKLLQINANTARLQNQLWSAVRSAVGPQSPPILGLLLSGMNDVLNSQGYTQAAWWNRIPPAAWLLMFAVAICCNFLIGYDARRAQASIVRLLVLPLVLSIAFFAIADIDSPRRGVIRVQPQNLQSLAESLH